MFSPLWYDTKVLPAEDTYVKQVYLMSRWTEDHSWTATSNTPQQEQAFFSLHYQTLSKVCAWIIIFDLFSPGKKDSLCSQFALIEGLLWYAI
jgi:hypothetical protein